MNNEANPTNTPIGLYRDPESGRFMGAIDEQQAAAMLRAGYKLYEEGYDAAMKSDAELESLQNPPEHDTSNSGRAFDPKADDASSSKKGGK